MRQRVRDTASVTPFGYSYFRQVLHINCLCKDVVSTLTLYLWDWYTSDLDLALIQEHQVKSPGYHFSAPEHISTSCQKLVHLSLFRRVSEGELIMPYSWAQLTSGCLVILLRNMCGFKGPVNGAWLVIGLVMQALAQWDHHTVYMYIVSGGQLLYILLMEICCSLWELCTFVWPIACSQVGSLDGYQLIAWLAGLPSRHWLWTLGMSRVSVVFCYWAISFYFTAFCGSPMVLLPLVQL